VTAPSTPLSPAEIAKIKENRSSARGKPSLHPAHWDKPVGQSPPFVAAPRPYHIERLVVKTFNRNNLGQQDLQYMAQALLQLLDKCHELEARVNALESETSAK
jgi:hypothetical protein